MHQPRDTMGMKCIDRVVLELTPLRSSGHLGRSNLAAAHFQFEPLGHIKQETIIALKQYEQLITSMCRWTHSTPNAIEQLSYDKTGPVTKTSIRQRNYFSIIRWSSRMEIGKSIQMFRFSFDLLERKTPLPHESQVLGPSLYIYICVQKWFFVSQEPFLGAMGWKKSGQHPGNFHALVRDQMNFFLK